MWASIFWLKVRTELLQEFSPRNNLKWFRRLRQLIRTCAYEGVRNANFSENSAYVLNTCSSFGLYSIITLWLTLNNLFKNFSSHIYLFTSLYLPIIHSTEKIFAVIYEICCHVQAAPVQIQTEIILHLLEIILSLLAMIVFLAFLAKAYVPWKLYSKNQLNLSYDRKMLGKIGKKLTFLTGHYFYFQVIVVIFFSTCKFVVQILRYLSQFS